MDAIGWFIATTHDLIGHNQTAALIGEPPGDRNACLLCINARERTEETRQAVIDALAPVSVPGQEATEGTER